MAGLGAASEDEVTSPSFTLVHEYGSAGSVYHADLYRIEGARDLATLGLDDYRVRRLRFLLNGARSLAIMLPYLASKSEWSTWK